MFKPIVIALVTMTLAPTLLDSFPTENDAHKNALEVRQKRVKAVCQRYFDANSTAADAECDAMASNEARKLVFDYKLYGCVPRGAGSRFWDTAFNTITEDLMKRGSPDTPEKYVAFSTCRHPYQRIALAYAVEAKRMEKSGKRKQILPFTKYVEKEVLAASASGTWKSPYLRPCNLDCNPCCTHFDVISDYATLSQDFETIKASQRFDPRAGLPEPDRAHEHDGTTIDPTTMTKYFAGLPKALVDGIYKAYRRDFELYGYDVKNYL